MKTLTILLLVAAALMGCDGGGAADDGAWHGTPEPASQQMLVTTTVLHLDPGEDALFSSFRVTDDRWLKFALLSNLQPAMLSAPYVGQVVDPDPHHTYAWANVAEYSPFEGQSPTPLIAGDYELHLRCRDDATDLCTVAIRAWLEVP